jgi:hypothetical protein
MGGDADLTFPTRDASIINASGEARLRISKTEAFIHIGWPPQDPLRIEAGGILKEFSDITAEAGLNIDIKAHKAQFFFDADAEFDVGPASVDGHLGGTLDLNDVGSPGKEFSADGSIDLDATVDFGLFTASADASLSAKFNTSGHRGELYLSGTLHGKAGPFEASVDVDKHIKVN